MYKITVRIIQIITIFILCSINVQAKITEQAVMEKLDMIKSITVSSDSATLAGYNKSLDESWTFFNENKKDVAPILAREINLELKKDNPNDFFLLDIGYFLYTASDKDKQYIEISKNALFKLNPKSEIIIANYNQLFDFTHKVASDRDPRILDFIDKAFLFDSNNSIPLPQHSMELDPTSICVFLYGVYGPDAEEHLLPFLKNKTVTKKILEILVWIGSVRSINEVNNVMLSQQDYEIFLRATTFMVQVGGPSGKDIILNIDADKLDQKSQQHYDKMIQPISAMSFGMMKEMFAKFPGDSTLTNEELKKRLLDMYDNYGRDENTNPIAYLKSDLPKDYLLEELSKIKSRMFYRISDESLRNVQFINFLINTLYYRDN